MHPWIARIGFVVVIGYIVLCFVQAYYHIPLWFDMPSLPESARGQKIQAQGQISNFPFIKKGQTFFYFTITAPKVYAGSRFSVRVPFEYPFFILGEHWQFPLILSPIGGFKNPGLAHYPWTMSARGIYGRGVGPDRFEEMHQLKKSTGLFRLRHYIRSKMLIMPETPGRALVLAIMLGDKTMLNNRIRSVMAPSGLSHLLAVSGMHIGMIAGIGFFLGQYIWRLSFSFFYSEALYWRISVGCMLAVLYSCLSGWALSTQRAFVALIVIALYKLWFGNIQWRHSFIGSLVIVLWLNPLAPMLLDFWLSFGAIALLLLCFDRQHRRSNRVIDFCQAQCILTIGLLPAAVLMGGIISCWSFFLNALVIPLLGMVILPITLLSLVLSFFESMLFFEMLIWCLDQGFIALEGLMNVNDHPDTLLP